MPLDDSTTRCVPRTRNQNKSHLPKYSSFPELQLITKQRPLYHCRQCGFTNSVKDPMCLWCAWTCKEARNEFITSMPRARRASAPTRVFVRFVMPSTQTEMKAESSVIDPPAIVPQTLIDGTTPDDGCVHSHRDHIFDIDYRRQQGLHRVAAIPEGLGHGVATATRSSPTSPLSFAQTRTVAAEPVEHKFEENDSAMKSNITVKVPRSAFNVGRADKIPLFDLDDDAHEHAKNAPLTHNDLTSPPVISTHPTKQNFRPLRRKNHLHVMHSPLDSKASEPIAISLTLRHSPPPTPSHLSKKSFQRLTDYVSPHSHTRAHSHPQSFVESVSSSTGDPVTPPMTPTHQRPPPNSVPPKASTTGSTESSPVRLGHPSRPYYTAIRKNAISPPSSRLRPQSQPPPSSFQLGATTATVVPMTSTMANPSRHLSMSAMTSSPHALSALYDGDDDDDDIGGDYDIHSGPSNSARLSLSSSLHRVSYNKYTQTHAHHAQSLSRAAKGMINHPSSGVGFSMSGETELRMALATSPSGTATLGRMTQDGFRFRETVVPSENIIGPANVDYLHNRGDGFMDRVKRLRRGLKQMLITKKNTMTTGQTTRMT